MAHVQRRSRNRWRARYIYRTGGREPGRAGSRAPPSRPADHLLGSRCAGRHTGHRSSARASSRSVQESKGALMMVATERPEWGRLGTSGPRAGPPRAPAEDLGVRRAECKVLLDPSPAGSLSAPLRPDTSRAPCACLRSVLPRPARFGRGRVERVPGRPSSLLSHRASPSIDWLCRSLDLCAAG